MAKYCEGMLEYESDSGVFTWLESPCPAVFPGDVAGTVNKRGYRSIQVNRKIYPAHRLAWRYVYGSFPVVGVDHMNGKKDDNRIENLRLADNTLNKQNMRTARKDSSTGLLGVKPHLGRYQARISFGGKRHSLGLFDTEPQAHAAYIKAKRIHHEGCTI